MHTKKIDIYIYIYLYTVYTWPLTTDTREIQRLVERSPFFPPEPLSPKQRLWNKSSRKRVHIERDSSILSQRGAVLPDKRGTGPDASRSCQSACDLYRRSSVGRDGQHHKWLRVSRADREHTACFFFQPERVMYSTTVTLFSQRDHYIQNKAMCRRGRGEPADGTEKVHYSRVTLAQMISTLFLFLFLFYFLIFFCKWLSLKINSQPTNVWQVVIIYPLFFFLSYSNISWSTSRHQWQPQREKKNTSEDASAHEHFV